MNKKQKALLKDFVVVTAVTFVTVLAMICLKGRVNRLEATRAMDQLGKNVLGYRQQYGAVPAESYILNIKEDLPGAVRLGEIYYRARWLEFDAGDDEILACSTKSYPSLSGNKFIVLRLNGDVRLMKPQQLKALLDQQQSLQEKTQGRGDFLP